MWHTEVKRTKVGDSVLKYLCDEVQTCEFVGNSRHAAAVVYKGKIISVGKCTYKTHTRMLEFQTNEHKIHLHAEVDAIVRAEKLYGKDFLKDCDLYVIRMGRNNKISNSKPCVGCQKAILAYNLKHVYWSE